MSQVKERARGAILRKALSKSSKPQADEKELLMKNVLENMIPSLTRLALLDPDAQQGVNEIQKLLRGLTVKAGGAEEKGGATDTDSTASTEEGTTEE